MIRITDKEAAQLRKMGVKEHEGGISHTNAHHKTYYLCESRKNLEKLRQLRPEV